ncbi:MAG: nitrilase-related carbon-nitrogen hydrolase, partial [Bacillota bacterium]|nr:nitrilase-related carbon-nitrogen hydrolase [Bacillota bacterium]
AMADLAARAAAAGAQLLLFPALSGMLLTPDGAKAVRRWAEGRPAGADRSASAAWAEEAAGFLSGLARRHRLHLAASHLVAEGDGWRHEAVVFGSEGAELGRQAQTHASRREAAAGLRPASRLAVIDTPLGRLGLAIGTDTWYPEVSRILTLSGADVLLFPQAVVRPYPLWRQVAGAWQEVQQNQVFGLESGLAGGSFIGRAAVFGPCELTPGQTGQLAGVGPSYTTVDALQPFAGDSRALHEEALVTAVLDFGKLDGVRRAYPILSMLNPDAYQRYFPSVYEGAAKEGGGP